MVGVPRHRYHSGHRTVKTYTQAPPAITKSAEGDASSGSAGDNSQKQALSQNEPDTTRAGNSQEAKPPAIKVGSRVEVVLKNDSQTCPTVYGEMSWGPLKKMRGRVVAIHEEGFVFQPMNFLTEKQTIKFSCAKRVRPLFLNGFFHETLRIVQWPFVGFLYAVCRGASA